MNAVQLPNITPQTILPLESITEETLVETAPQDPYLKLYQDSIVDIQSLMKLHEQIIKTSKVTLLIFISLAIVTFLSIPATLTTWFILPLSALLGPLLLTVAVVVFGVIAVFSLIHVKNFKDNLEMYNSCVIDYLKVVDPDHAERFKICKKYASTCTFLDFSLLETTVWTKERVIELLEGCQNLNSIKLGPFYAYDDVHAACKGISTQFIGDLEMESKIKFDALEKSNDKNEIALKLEASKHQLEMEKSKVQT